MADLSSERAKSWDIYTTNSDPSPSQTQVNRADGSWKDSMNAISFGFVATAILISMFLIMAIFEHLFKPNTSFSDSRGGSRDHLESRRAHKVVDPKTVPTTYAPDFSVLMPGQKYPTFIAQPAPPPCRREGVYWPSHEHNFAFP